MQALRLVNAAKEHAGVVEGLRRRKHLSHGDAAAAAGALVLKQRGAAEDVQAVQLQPIAAVAGQPGEER
jgi:hypothetical protein